MSQAAQAREGAPEGSLRRGPGQGGEEKEEEVSVPGFFLSINLSQMYLWQCRMSTDILHVQGQGVLFLQEEEEGRRRLSC